MKDTEIKIMPVDKPLKNTVMCHERVKLTMVAQLAKEFTQTMVMAQIANVVQGRESVLMTNHQLIKKACDLADEMFIEFKKRDWLLDMPSLKDLAEDNSYVVGFREAS